MKHILFLISLLAIVAALGFQAQPVLAQCTPDGTATSNNIVCSGTDTNGVNGLGGQDTITVNTVNPIKYG